MEVQLQYQKIQWGEGSRKSWKLLCVASTSNTGGEEEEKAVFIPDFAWRTKSKSTEEKRSVTKQIMRMKILFQTRRFFCFFFMGRVCAEQTNSQSRNKRQQHKVKKTNQTIKTKGQRPHPTVFYINKPDEEIHHEIVPKKQPKPSNLMTEEKNKQTLKLNKAVVQFQLLRCKERISFLSSFFL